MTSPLTRVAFIEDHRATREAFMKLLRGAPDMVCVAAYANAEQAEREIAEANPKVVIMDINLPGRNGIECVEKLKFSHPEMEFIMLTTYDDADLIFNALRAGASGYLLKRAAAAELLPAIRDVLKGGSPMSMEIARRVVLHFRQPTKQSEDLEALSKREQEILELLAKGLPYKQIADQLDISPNTVHAHLRRIYGKLHVQSRTEAVVKYLAK